MAALVIWMLNARVRHAAWTGLAFCATVIVVSTVYYNPVIMLERQPGMVDWIEDVVFTGLSFAAGTQLLDHVARARRRATSDEHLGRFAPSSGGRART